MILRHNKPAGHKPGHRLWWLIVAAAAGAGAVAVYRHFLPPLSRRKPGQSVPFALVLGCGGHDDGTTSRSQRGRCQLAIDEYDKGSYQTLILSGGAVRNAYIEAEVMKNWIDQQRARTGQPPIPMILETEARNTWENFSHTRELTGDVPILIMTGSMHARRAGAIASSFFSDYRVASYPDFTLKKFCREIVSRSQYCSIELLKRLGLYGQPEKPRDV